MSKNLEVLQQHLDEVRKEAASRARMQVPQSRSGRRPMRVDTMLRKDREGSLWREHLPGGLAAGKKPADFDQSALLDGKKVEREHTSNPSIATEIAMDHLTEDPEYYTKLRRMEGEEKRAGLLEALKAPIPGTKDWFIRTGKQGLQGAAKVTRGVPLRQAATSTRGGVTGISSAEMARLGFGDLLKQSGVRVDSLQELQAKLQPGDILLTRAIKPSLMSNVVSRVQGSDYGHSALYVGNGRVIDTRNRGEGVHRTTLKDVFERWGGGRDIRAYAPRVGDDARQEAVARAKSLVGTPYSNIKALRMALPASGPKDVDLDSKPKAVTCSELIVRAYPQLQFGAAKHREQVMPVDIAKSPLVKRVAELAHPVEKTAYKLQGHTEFQGLPIAIENRKGSVRSGVDKDGKPWRTKFKIPYGYIKNTEGRDGEEIDAYVGPHSDAEHAYVVHQRHITGKGHDEDKVMLGFRSVEEAKAAYLAHYNDAGKKLLGPISTIRMDELLRKLEEKRKHTKLAWDGTGSNALVRLLPIDPDARPDTQKPGDVPSRDGGDPGVARIVKHESGPGNAAVLPTDGALMTSSTGAMTRL